MHVPTAAVPPFPAASSSLKKKKKLVSTRFERVADSTPRRRRRRITTAIYCTHASPSALHDGNVVSPLLPRHVPPAPLVWLQPFDLNNTASDWGSVHGIRRMSWDLTDRCDREGASVGRTTSFLTAWVWPWVSRLANLGVGFADV